MMMIISSFSAPQSVISVRFYAEMLAFMLKMGSGVWFSVMFQSKSCSRESELAADTVFLHRSDVFLLEFQ